MEEKDHSINLGGLLVVHVGRMNCCKTLQKLDLLDEMKSLKCVWEWGRRMVKLWNIRIFSNGIITRGK